MSVKVKANLNIGKIKAKTANAERKTKLKLKFQIAKDTNKYVPMRNGHLRNSVYRSVKNRDNFLKWTTPYAHFQWFGEVMVGVKSHSPWAKRHEKKEYAGRPLSYVRGGKDWFNVAKGKHGTQWVNLAEAWWKEGFK